MTPTYVFTVEHITADADRRRFDTAERGGADATSSLDKTPRAAVDAINLHTRLRHGLADQIGSCVVECRLSSRELLVVLALISNVYILKAFSSGESVNIVLVGLRLKGSVSEFEYSSVTAKTPGLMALTASAAAAATTALAVLII